MQPGTESDGTANLVAVSAPTEYTVDMFERLNPDADYQRQTPNIH